MRISAIVKQLEMLRRDGNEWNDCRREYQDVQPDLREANFRGAYLRRVVEAVSKLIFPQVLRIHRKLKVFRNHGFPTSMSLFDYTNLSAPLS